MSGKLEKLKILDAESGDTLFESQFNPTEVNFSKSVEWKEGDEDGGDVQYQEFKHGKGEQFDFKLFFDTTSTNDNVYMKYIGKIDKLTRIDVEKHRPPILHVIWGKMFLMQCILTSVDQNFTMFAKDGTALRCEVSLKFVQVVKFGEARVESGECQSPDHTKIRVLRKGDTLQSLSHYEYEDVKLWKIIAEHNNIEDPLNIPVGTVIEIPALQD